MHTVKVSTKIRAPIDDVFAHLSDHEAFLCGPGLESCTLTKEGDTERNGEGAVRRVVSRGGIVLVEDIGHFERPLGYSYKVSSITWQDRLSIPVEHEGGSIELFETDGLTQVDWVSRFRCPVPVVGKALERLVGKGSSKALQGILDLSRTRLEASRKG